MEICGFIMNTFAGVQNTFLEDYLTEKDETKRKLDRPTH